MQQFNDQANLQLTMSQNLRNLVEEQAELHQILSNPTRLLILRSLEKQEMSVGEIAEQIGATLYFLTARETVNVIKTLEDEHGQINYNQARNYRYL